MLVPAGAQRFYNIMFERHPGTRAYFSRGSFLSDGKPPVQVVRLFRAVTAFARHVETPEVLTGVVRRVAEIHVSRNVRGHQYEVVGACLLAAMEEVLGMHHGPGGGLDEWAAAYGWLAGFFKEVEQEVRARGKRLAGYEGFRQFEVVAAREERVGSIAALTMELRPDQTRGWTLGWSAESMAGKFVCLAFVSEKSKFREKVTAFLSDVAPAKGTVRVTVERSAVENRKPGSTIGVSPPFGKFELEKAAAGASAVVLLTTTGIEIGRMYAIIQAMLCTSASSPEDPEGGAPGPKIVLCTVPADPSGRSVLEDDISDLRRKHSERVSHVTIGGRPAAEVSAEEVRKALAGNASLAGAEKVSLLLTPTFSSIAKDFDEKKYEIQVVD